MEMREPGNAAMQAKVRERFDVLLRRWWENRPPVTEVMFILFGVAGLIALTAFEATGSARGWAMMTAGAMPHFVALFAGLFVTILYVVMHRQASEEFRSSKKTRGYRATGAAILAASLSLMGVFGNIASKTSVSAETARESNQDRDTLRAMRITLDRKVAAVDPSFVQAMIDADTATLNGMIAEAKGWGMADLDAAGACADDLRPRQRQLCNAANGSAGETGIRGQVAINEAALVTYEMNRAELDSLEKQLDSLSRKEGAAHWESMAQLTSGHVKADAFRIWGSFIASVFFLLCAGFGWDYWFERVEKGAKEA